MKALLHDSEAVADGGFRDDDLLQFGDLMRAAWRGKFQIGLCVLLGLIAAAIYEATLVTPRFRSETTVLVNPERILSSEGLWSVRNESAPQVSTEIEVLRSSNVLGEVVDRLDLTKDPEFNPGLASPGMLDSLSGILPWRRGGAVSGEEVADSGSEVDARSSAVSELASRLEITLVPDTPVFVLGTTSTDPEKAALLANTLIDVHIERRKQAERGRIEEATAWLTDRVASLQGELSAAELAVAEFRNGSPSAVPETVNAMEAQLGSIRAEVSLQEEDQRRLVQRAQDLEAAETLTEKAEAAGNPTLSQLLSEANSGGAAAERFEQQFEAIRQRAEYEARQADVVLASLVEEQSRLESLLEDARVQLIELQWLEREAAAARVLYDALSAQLRETVALQGLEPVVPEVLSQASAPSQPIGPGKSTVFGLSGFLGAIIGIGIVLFRESRHVLFYSARSLELATGRKVLGQIPELRQRRPQLVLRYLQQQQTSSFAEAFRSLRTSLEPLDGSTGQVILMTSAVPDEGKSIASLGLAHSFATAGRKVLLVDCDTRRPTLGKFLTHPNPLGLLDVLSGSVRLDEAVSRAPGLDIDFLLVEKGRRIAADLFSSESTDLLMSAFRQHYEIVIIDTPPLLAVNDARVLARGADKVLLVARWASTSASQLEEAMRLIEIRKQQISGLVLSRVDPRRMREYGIGRKSGPYAMLHSAYHDN